MPAEKKAEKDSQYRKEVDGKTVRRRGRHALHDLYKFGRRINGRYITIIFSYSEDDNSTYAIFVPRRLGNPVLRNKARRVFKELIRTQPHPGMKKKDIIILYKQKIDKETLNKAGEELGRLLCRLPGETKSVPYRSHTD